MQYIKYFVAFIVIAVLVYFGLTSMQEFTPEAFAVISAAILAVAFERFPWLQQEFDQLPDEVKQGLMFIFMAVLVYGAYGLSCAGLLAAFQCTGAGAVQALLVLVAAIIANQSVYQIAKKGKDT